MPAGSSEFGPQRAGGGCGTCSQSFKAGGRQVKVDPGLGASPWTASTPRRARKSRFDQVLFLEKDGGEMLAGAPFVANAKVVGVVDGESRGPKIRVFKKKRRKGIPQDQGPPQHATRACASPTSWYNRGLLGR